MPPCWRAPPAPASTRSPPPIPTGTGEQLVQRVRSEVWSRPVEGLELVPTGAGFAAFSLGFLSPTNRSRCSRPGRGPGSPRAAATCSFAASPGRSRPDRPTRRSLRQTQSAADGTRQARPDGGRPIRPLSRQSPTACLRGCQRAARVDRRAARPAAPGEQAAAEERALERAVAVHAAAAESAGLTGRVQAGHRLPVAPSTRADRSVSMPPRLLRVRMCSFTAISGPAFGSSSLCGLATRMSLSPRYRRACRGSR